MGILQYWVPNRLLEIGGFARETTKMVRHVLRDGFMSGQHGAIFSTHLVLSFERQPKDELTVHRHNGVEVETDMVVDCGYVAPSAL